TEGPWRAGMNAVLSHQGASTQSDVAARLAFQKQLQAVTNKIHATNNIDEIMLEVSADICVLFNADRLTIYAVGEDRQAIVSKVKTGLNSFKDLKLPIAEHSIAGYVALAKKTVNIKDVYDDGELRGLNANRSEEHTSELQSHLNLVCRLLLENKNEFMPMPAGPELIGRARTANNLDRQRR